MSKDPRSLPLDVSSWGLIAADAAGLSTPPESGHRQSAGGLARILRLQSPQRRRHRRRR